MGRNSGIEWTDHTFNPWWGCVKVSAACNNCYAEKWAHRLGYDIWGRNAPRRFFGDRHWLEPIRWDAAARREGVRRRVFCASMADVFEGRSDLHESRSRLWKLIDATPHLDWLLLTKRPWNVLRMVPWQTAWPANVWIGTTAENQKWYEHRAPHLADIPAAVVFISFEPLLGPITLNGWRLDWAIVGGESGPKARPMNPDWARALRDECLRAGVAFHFKQWGEWSPNDLCADDELMHRVGKKAAGRLLDGREWNELPAKR